MINLRLILLFCFLIGSIQESFTQDFDFEKARQVLTEEFNQYRKRKQQEFNEFRRKRNEEFAEYVRKQWRAFESQPEVPRPKEEEVPPVVIEEETPQPPVPNPLPFDEVIVITEPKPQPKPIDPIKELPQDEPVTENESVHDFVFFGTPGKVRIDKSRLFRLRNTNESSIADAWMELSAPVYTNLVHDCLQIRETNKLCDWGYLMMLQEMASSICGKNTNEATLLTAYVYCQTGYKMRLAHNDGKLYMLYASNHGIYDKRFFNLDGEKYYIMGESMQELFICEAKYPKETSMSLCISRPQRMTWQDTPKRKLQSERYPEMQASIACNKNIIDFFNTYPTSTVNGNFMTRWALYANTPFEKEITDVLYPQLRAAIGGLSQKESVERLLNWTQTAFEYEYDDKVWGGDRAFFPEETLHYPYADCEDRSILFTRIVRDLLGLKCILIYYPGHLASAVCFTETVHGDYVSLQGNKYVVCDPTYINAPVGRTMPGMNNQEAKVILLE